MRTFFSVTAFVVPALMAAPVMAQDTTGPWQIKVLGTAVLPDGEINSVELDTVDLPATTQTTANDNYVPTLAIEYFLTPNVSLETICCVTQHDVDATAGLPGAELVSDAKLVPATLTVKYHFNPGGLSPYIGAGPTYFLFFDEEPGAATLPLGITGQNLSNELGLAVQAGIDIPVGRNFAVSFDAKRYFVGTTATWYAGGTPGIQTEHDLDPWVLSAGVGVRF